MSAAEIVPGSPVPPTQVKQDAMVIGLVGFAHAISHFFHMILAPLFPWIKEAFSLSYAELGLLMTVFFVISGIGQALSGFVVDKLGARTVLFFGISCLGFAALVLSSAQNYAMLLMGAMLAGVGNSVFHPSDYTLLNKRVSPARLGYAFSVHGISGNLGWAAAPVFLVTIAQFTTWRTALFCAAFLPFMVLTLLFIYRDLLHTDIVPATHPHASAHAKEGVLDFLKLPAIWMCFGFFFMSAMALGGIQSFSAAGLRDLYGMSLNAATTAYTMFMLASACGMLLGGFLAARASHHDRIITLAFSLAGVFSLLLATGWSNTPMAIVLMAGIGFGSGIAGPSRDLLIRSATPKNATGRVYGIVYSGLDSGLAVAPLLFGAIMDGRHSSWVFICVGVFQVLTILTAVNVGGRTRALAAV
ncbi:MFS transporter [Undibacterium sp. FT147W]|uniref:MFS transporter n=1 Tax=Undibacterium rivi TaxID=2828729 RepID=A0ABS5GZJ4_9BURK|nr:MFS transporter [Undibacterium rivi]MBR7791827.1 MFS transporter [Undibacterium rivi]